MSVTIKVVYPSGNIAAGTKVCLGFTMGMSDVVYTDDYGEAEFPTIEAGRTGSIYVDGKEVFSNKPLPRTKTVSL